MKKLTLPATLTVKELSDRLSVSGPQVIRYLMGNGVMANLNQALDFDTMALAADHFGFEAESEDAAPAAAPAEARRVRHPLLDLSKEDPASLVARPPVVTVLGHVDHGKTSLLDAIRQTKVAAGEAGGITQRIGAYQIEKNGKLITFIDTPGHAAFTAMRARGADVTDVAVLVVAADDGVMPQTEEAIQHARTAGVPILIALNKVDRDNANPDRVLQQLAERDLIPEEYGGTTTVVRTSARTGQGIDELLDMILLLTEIEEPKANPNRPAVGTVIDAHLERGRGPIATALVQNGTLRIGDNIVAGSVFGKVRALIDDTGKRVKEAGPSLPVVVTGLSDVVVAGEIFQVMDTERAARSLAEQRGFAADRQRAQPVRRITLADLASQVAEGGLKTLNLIIKAEANGSLEALKGQILKIEDPTVRIKIVADSVGEVGESDVNLAAVSDSIVIGFNVKPDVAARAAAESQGVDVRYYDVIYQVTDDIVKAIRGLYEPTFVEVLQGRAEVRKVFTVDGRASIAGSYVTEGKITRNAIVRVIRDSREVAKGRMAQLRRFRDDVREVAQGYECGITLEDFSEFQEKDILEAYVVEQQNL
ncbi:MAG: translation initiation factor [Chloroflexota bacterium]|nr:translation initiation factor [Chloroflexota bacterium]